MNAVKRVAGTIVFWGAWPYWYLTLYATNRTRVLICCGDEALLTTPTLGTNRWSLPGGGIKRDEKPAESACREIQEELGLKLSPDQLQPLAVERIHESTGLTYKCYLYGVELTEQPTVRPSIELMRCEWMPVEQIKKNPVQNLVKRAVALWAAR